MAAVQIIFFALGLAAVAGIVIGLLVGIVLAIYSFPYICWIAWNSGTKGIPKHPESEKMPGRKYLMHCAKNATKLYRSWITKRPHGITQF